MTGLLENNSPTTRTHNDPNAPLDLVPLDLLTPPEERNPDHAVTEPSDLGNAAGRLRAEIVSSLQSVRSSDEALPQLPSAGPQGPRLDRVPTLSIRPATTMPRHGAESSDFAALTSSIKRNGLVQPLLVRILSNEPKLYELFAGYRRWRAALAAKIDYVPVIVFERLNEAVALELNLLENLNRRDFSIIEEAEAFRVLVEKYRRTPAQIASLSGRSRSQVVNMLCLVALPEAVRLKLRKGQISFEHGRALIGVTDPTALVNRIVAERLTVRETELLATQLRSAAQATEGTSAKSDSGTKVTDSTPNSMASTIAPAESCASKDLRVLQAALRTAIGAEFEVRTNCHDSDLLIGSQSAQDTAKAVSVLCEAMRLLRINGMDSTASRRSRAG